MNVDGSKTSDPPGPPDDPTEGWKRIDGGGERYWDGTGWTERTRTGRAGTADRIWQLFGAFARRGRRGYAGGLGLLILVLVVVFVTAALGMKWGQLLGGGDSEQTEVAEQSATDDPVDSASPPEQPAAPIGQTTEPEPEPEPQPADCGARTFVGSVTVDFEGWPVGTALTSEARFVIDAAPDDDPPRPGCRSSAEFVWLGSGFDQRFEHEVNPSGSFCSILLGEDGDVPLTWTPDGRGGGTLSGTMLVRGQVGWVADFGDFAETCPPVESALQYAFPLDPPVPGEFTATVSDGTLVGGGTFLDPRGFAFDGLAPSGGIGGRTNYVVDVTAAETGG